MFALLFLSHDSLLVHSLSKRQLKEKLTVKVQRKELLDFEQVVIASCVLLTSVSCSSRGREEREGISSCVKEEFQWNRG